MIDANIFLLVLGVAFVGCGSWLAVTAPARERQQARGVELRAAARGDLGPPDRWMSAALFRVLGVVTAVCGVLLVLLSQV